MLIDGLLIAGSIWLTAGFFSRKRKRARWARIVLGASGMIGLAYGVTYLALDSRWLVLTDDNSYLVHTLLHHTGGLLLGFLLSVVIAGETEGKKTDAPTSAPTI